MVNKFQGSCLCGRVQFELEGEFQSFFLCHCKRCQKDTGSAHAANLFITSCTLTWVAGENTVKTYQHANSQHAKSFCQNCGSAVPTVADDLGLIVVPAGSLDNPEPIVPTAKIFVGSKASWSYDLGGVPSFEELPEQSKR